MKTVNDISLRDTIPESIAKDENVSSAITAIDKQLHAIAKAAEIPSVLFNIDTLTSAQLDHLAAQFDVGTWREKWSVSVKRNVLKTAISDKRIKGTRIAVTQAIESLGSAASIKEWWQEEPKGEPHTFKVQVAMGKIEGQLESETIEDILAMIEDAKPLRSHYDFILGVSVEGGMNTAGCVRALTVGQVRSRLVVNHELVGARLGMLAVSRPIVSRHLIGKGV